MVGEDRVIKSLETWQAQTIKPNLQFVGFDELLVIELILIVLQEYNRSTHRFVTMLPIVEHHTGHIRWPIQHLVE